MKLISVATCRCFVGLFALVLVNSLDADEASLPGEGIAKEFAVSSQDRAEIQVHLAAGRALEISARVLQPSRLPDNARLRADWRLVRADDPGQAPRAPAGDAARPIDFDGIHTAPTADFSKLLHALDADVYTVYRAPVSGLYRLTVAAEEGSVDLFERPRWREKGKAPAAFPVPTAVPWPEGAKVNVAIALSDLDLAGAEELGLHVEAEPNDTPEQAQPIPLQKREDDYALHVVGGSDDIEYFDNGRVGASGDDWLRLEYHGAERRLLTACLSIVDQQVAARIRAYRIKSEDVEQGKADATPGTLLPIAVYEEGKNPNERVHQQEEQHRIAISRWLDPGGVYFLRVEANSPGYDLELRVVRPAPFDDPRQAVRHGMYDHLGQVDAWLANRPRGASVERRIRDSGNLLGTNCMSCHTQSGVWGPAVPLANGYRPRNIQLWRHLINTCYQSLRPTNELVEAANNTSLRPFDLGDGPAGTRVAGHAVVSLERFMDPRRLQSMQARRTANFVLQSSDPGGINAAGPGANVGQGVVFNYAGEILWTAWNDTGATKYFHALEDKARRMLKIDVKYTDDLGHRVEFFSRFFPKTDQYLATVKKYAKEEGLDATKRAEAFEKAKELDERIRAQIPADIDRLRAIQLEAGGWAFHPGSTEDGGKTWNVTDKQPDPSPTALAIIAFEAAGFGPDDPTVAKGVEGLLAMQLPTGYWNGKSKTGFVSTAYGMHALARLFPVDPPTYEGAEYHPRANETLLEMVARQRRLSVGEDPRFVPQLIDGAKHASPLVRYWACIGLGATHTDEGVAPLVANLGHPVKMVREAAHWGLRQTLIDDRGWEQALAAAGDGDDYARAAALRALVMKVDGVLPRTSVAWTNLTDVLGHALNDDPHPAVRAWATRAAWQWWVWNPPVRPALNQAWTRLICRPEANAVTENAVRYQSHALFIANGHVANATKKHQYKELADLFALIHGRLEQAGKHDPERAQLIAGRLASISSTFYGQRGGDGGPGQLGYSTEGAGELFGDAVIARLDHIEKRENDARSPTFTRISLEGAANIPHEGLQQRLVDYSLNGPEDLRGIAAASLSDPRLVSLVAVPEQLEPMYRQLSRGALEPERRGNLSDPILKMYRGVHWVIPENRQQRDEILQYIIPETHGYQSAARLKKIEEGAPRTEAARKSDAVWYLAEGLGLGVAENPDLHFDALLEAMPGEAADAAQQRFWLRSVPWVLGYKRALPEVKEGDRKLPPIDPYELVRSRALKLFLDQLREEADPRNRKVAVDLANGTALRRNPEVLSALERLLKFEKDKKVGERAKKVLSQNRGDFVTQLTEAVRKETKPQFEDALPADFVEDVTYFRDYVLPEMTRVLRGDERSCMICHGEPGRVPSMELHHPDEVGYLSTDKLLANYRILQDRVAIADVEKSKLLRKPLNVQTGAEDGHQGGRRYQPMDDGYLILRRWVLNQVPIQRKYGRPTLPAKAE